MTANETVIIAALMGFSTYPARDNDAEWLLQNCDAVSFGLQLKDLPTGGWASQGYAYECAMMVTVPVDSAEAESAMANHVNGTDDPPAT